MVIGFACIGKIVGATLSAKIMKCSWRESVTIGILMNCKGLVELIALNVGLDIGVLNTKVFTIFVLMALFNTIITTPLVSFVWLRHQQKENIQKDPVEGVFQTFVVASEPKYIQLMVNVSAIFLQLRDQFNTKVLMLNEISDRPSSYFFSEYYTMIQDLAFTADAKFLLADTKQLSKEKGVELEYKTLASSNLPQGIL